MSSIICDQSITGTLSVSGDTTFSAGVVKKGSGGYYLNTSAGGFRAAFWDNGSETRIFADGDGSTAAIVIDGGDTAFAGIVSINTGKSFRLYNAAGDGWGELNLNETDNKIQFNRGIQPSGDNQSDQLLGTASKRWHTVNAGAIVATGEVEGGSLDINGNADISGNLTVSGTFLTLNGEYPRIKLTDSNNNDDYDIINNNGTFIIFNDTDSSIPLAIAGDNTVTLAGSVDIGSTLTLSAASFPTIQIGSANTYKILKDTGSGDTLEIYSGNAMGPTLEMNSSRNSTFYGSVDISNGGDLSVGDDLTMGSSGALLTLGNSSTVTLQHSGGYGGTLASNSTSGAFVIDSAHDITLDADGGQVYLKDGGTTRYTFNLDSTPELDVVGDFIIDGSGDVSIKATNDVYLRSGAGTHLTLDESGTGGERTLFSIKTNHPDNIKAVFGTGQSSDGDWHIYANGGTNSDLVIESLTSNTGVGNIILRNKYQGDIEFADGTSTIFRMDNSSNALIVNSGNVTLEGTGRIQGIDTVSASTDAANKAYVDAAVSGGGSVQSFQSGGFYHSISSSSSTVYWLPTNYVIESTSSQYYNTWVAPHDGQVKKIIMRWASGSTPTATSVTFKYAINGTTNIASFTPTTVNAATTSMKTTMNFTGLSTIQFSEGDKFKLGFMTNGGSRLLYGFSYTVQLEYDI